MQLVFDTLIMTVSAFVGFATWKLAVGIVHGWGEPGAATARGLMAVLGGMAELTIVAGFMLVLLGLLMVALMPLVPRIVLGLIGR